MCGLFNFKKIIIGNLWNHLQAHHHHKLDFIILCVCLRFVLCTLRSPFHSNFNDIAVFSPFSHQVGILTGIGTDKERKIRKSNHSSLKWLNLRNISLHQQSTLFTLCFWRQRAKLTSVITSSSWCASPSWPCLTYVQTILVDFSQGLRVHSTNTWTFDLLVTDKS